MRREIMRLNSPRPVRLMNHRERLLDIRMIALLFPILGHLFEFFLAGSDESVYIPAISRRFASSSVF